MLQLMPADCNNASAAMRKDLRSGRWKIFENDFVFPWLKSSLGVASHGASLPDHQVRREVTRASAVRAAPTKYLLGFAVLCSAESFLGCAYRCAERRFAGLGCTIGAGRRTPPLMIDERIAALSVRALRSKGVAPRMRQKRVETIVAIQVLRAIAALAVVLSHSAFDLQRFGYGSPGPLSHFHLGDAGVDLFFVISGFVMVYASEPLFGRAIGALSFFIHRLIRIVPLYWLVTTIYVAISMPTATYDLQTIAASYLFVPLPRPDGIMQPIVGQGWTLNYEMFFYVIFALAVLVPLRAAVIAASCTLFVMVAAGHVFAPLPPASGFWTDSIVLEFVFGMLIGLAYSEGVTLKQSIAVSLILFGFILIASGELVPHEIRVVWWGIPAALIVTGATFGRFAMRGPVWRPLVIVGNASYALYLIHPAPIRAVLMLARWIGFDLGQALWLYVSAAVVLSTLLAVVIYFWLERPVTTAMRRLAARSLDRLMIVEAEPRPVE
jgi:exopolysaccharide production protein ExoZ